MSHLCGRCCDSRGKILKLQEGGTGPAMHIVQCADSGYHTPLIATEATKCSDVVAIIESASADGRAAARGSRRGLGVGYRACQTRRGPGLTTSASFPSAASL